MSCECKTECCKSCCGCGCHKPGPKFELGDLVLTRLSNIGFVRARGDDWREYGIDVGWGYSVQFMECVYKKFAERDLAKVILQSSGNQCSTLKNISNMRNLFD